jgi:hypothetical protein
MIPATPYNWPYDGVIVPEHTALIVIDMQIDFCGKGGYVDRMGYDLSLTAGPIAPIQNLLNCVRRIPGFTIILVKAIDLIYQIYRRTSFGVVNRSVQELARQDQQEGFL